MAKANKTAMEDHIIFLKSVAYSLKENSAKRKHIQICIADAEARLGKERQQIDSAFYAAKTNNYDGPSHYYFMEYIDND